MSHIEKFAVVAQINSIKVTSSNEKTSCKIIDEGGIGKKYFALELSKPYSALSAGMMLQSRRYLDEVKLGRSIYCERRVMVNF